MCTMKGWVYELCETKPLYEWLPTKSLIVNMIYGCYSEKYQVAMCMHMCINEWVNMIVVKRNWIVTCTLLL